MLKNLYFDTRSKKKTFWLSRGHLEAQYVASWRLESKAYVIFEIPDPKKITLFRNPWTKIDFFLFYPPRGQFEARMWPQRNHKLKLMLLLKTLTQKTYISTPMKQKKRFWNMTSQRPLGGRFVASERSWSKTKAIFEMLYPRNLELDTQKPKNDTY